MNQILVVPYDPKWVEKFALASSEITAALGDNLLEIHHIGSTSIPEIHAKPVIDMLAIVADIATLDEYSEQFKSLGYEVMGEFGIEGRRYFRRDNAAGIRTHQIHTFQTGSPQIPRHLAFRDFLRTHKDLAEQYSDLKQKLAKAHPYDMNAYMDGKDDFIKEMEKRALAWTETDRLLRPIS